MSTKKKVLLMGKSGSGKTSMRSIIFTNYIAQDTMRLGVTIDVEHSHVRFLGNLVLNLWDCGGQESFMENYFSSQRDHIFKNVQVLIYVFDVDNKDPEKEIYYYKQCIEALQQNSSDSKIFCLIHKIDLIPDDQKEIIFKQRENELKQLSLPLKITCFKTSIWDETLYQAWSSIVYSLIPNVKVVESRLKKFCDICDADEVVLFEKATFLVISSAKGKKYEESNDEKSIERDPHRFQKISNIIKQFKLSCSKSQSQMVSMEIRNKHFCAYIDEFTKNTNMMIITSDSNIQLETTILNMNMVKDQFDSWINSS